MMAAGFEKVYEIGPIFRAEEHNTTKHLNEATSIDIEVSYADHLEVMRILEELIVKTYEYVSNDLWRPARKPRNHQILSFQMHHFPGFHTVKR